MTKIRSMESFDKAREMRAQYVDAIAKFADDANVSFYEAEEMISEQKRYYPVIAQRWHEGDPYGNIIATSLHLSTADRREYINQNAQRFLEGSRWFPGEYYEVSIGTKVYSELKSFNNGALYGEEKIEFGFNG